MAFMEMLPELSKLLCMAESFTANNDIKIWGQFRVFEFELESLTVRIGGKPARVAVSF